MRKLTAIFILLMSFLAAAPALAAGEIAIADNIVLRWQTGDLDPDDYSGDAGGVSLSIEGEKIFTADRLIIESEKNGDTVIADKMHMTNMQLTFGDTVMSARNIELEQLPLSVTRTSNNLNFNANADAGNLSGKFAFEGLDLRQSGLGIFTADEISFNPDAMKSLELPPKRESLGKVFTIRNLVFDLTANPPENDLLAALVKNGTFTVDASVEVFGQKRGDLNDYETIIDVSMKNLIRTNFTIESSLADEVLKTLEQSAGKSSEDITADEANAIMTMAMTQLFMKQVALTLEDRGVLAILKNYFRDEAGEDLVEETMEALVKGMSDAPMALAKIRNPVRAFLEQGGTITFSLTPPTPQPLGTVVAIQQSPDIVLQVLGFDVAHRPR